MPVDSDTPRDPAALRCSPDPAGAAAALLDVAAGVLLRVDGALAQLLQRPVADLVGAPLAALVHPEDLAAVRASLARLRDGSVGSFALELRLVQADGTALAVGATVAAAWAPGEAPRHAAVVVQQLERRRRAEQALQASEERWRAITQASREGFFDWDLAGEPLASDRWLEIFGFAPGQQVALAEWRQRIHPEDLAVAERSVEDHLEGRSALASAEYRVRLPGGEERWVRARALAQRDAAGRPVRLFGTVADITEPRRAEDALRAREARLAFALEGANDGLWDVDFQTGETYMSPRGCAILGYAPGELDGVMWSWTLIHPDDEPRTRAQLRAHVEGRAEILQVEQRLRTRAGDWRWVLTRGKVVARDAEGRPLRMCGTHTDITARVRADQEQERLRGELAQSQKMESIGRLAGGVAHDFNNMLQVIRGNAALALEELPPGGALREYLQEIEQSANHAAQLTLQLLAFARRQPVAPRVLDLDERVGSTLRMLRRLIGEDVALDWEPGCGPWLVKVDPGQLDQVLANLCVNARDAMAGRGRITIRTRRVTLRSDDVVGRPGCAPGEHVVLSVSDTGTGLAPEVRAHLFEPFFTTKTGKGTGLGLATVHGIVQQHHGFIQVESAPGAGTTFRIHLPRASPQAAAPGPAPAPAAAPGAGHETLLLVEDEPAVLALGKRILERHGYAVLTAPGPAAALALAAEHAGDLALLVTDVVMPGMNGLELRDRLRAARPGLPCVFVSGYAAGAIGPGGLLPEGVDLLPKPFDGEVLAAKVREVIDRGGGGRPR
ncbi:MAG: PAS domain-containing protein [Anaeromyxobacter sp.]